MKIAQIISISVTKEDFDFLVNLKKMGFGATEIFRDALNKKRFHLKDELNIEESRIREKLDTKEQLIRKYDQFLNEQGLTLAFIDKQKKRQETALNEVK
jgi:hypothetical protein